MAEPELLLSSFILRFIVLCVCFLVPVDAETSYLFVRLSLSSREEDVVENDDRQPTARQTHAVRPADPTTVSDLT